MVQNHDALELGSIMGNSFDYSQTVRGQISAHWSDSAVSKVFSNENCRDHTSECIAVHHRRKGEGW